MNTVIRAAHAPPASMDEWHQAPPSSLHRLHVRELWQFFRQQPWSFWFVCAYMFFEYVRPQAIYSIIRGMPFASWSIIAAAVAFLLEGRKLRRFHTVDGLLVIFTLIVLASSALAYWPGISFDKFFTTYFSWIIIYVIVTNVVDNEKRFLVFMALYFLWCLKMSQFGARMVVMRGFSFSSWGLTCAPQFFHNSGECGIQLAMFFASSLYFVLGLAAYLSRRTKWLVALLPATAAIAIMGSSSRGAQLALAAILIWMVLRSRRPVRALAAAAVAATLLFAILPEEQKQRFRDMGTDETSIRRRQYWSDGIKIANDHPVLGVGFQNWLAYYTRNYNSVDGQWPHNIFVEAGAELGYVGLSGFIMLILATFFFNHQTRKTAKRIPRGNFLWCMAHGLDGALIGFLVGGFFVTVLYYPFFWINLTMTVVLNNVTRRAAATAVRSRAPVVSPGARHAT